MNIEGASSEQGWKSQAIVLSINLRSNEWILKARAAAVPRTFVSLHANNIYSG